MEKVNIVNPATGENEEISFIVCMTKEQSQLLVNASRICIDTSHKRVQGYYEFVIEEWNEASESCGFMLVRSCNPLVDDFW